MTKTHHEHKLSTLIGLTVTMLFLFLFAATSTSAASLQHSNCKISVQNLTPYTVTDVTVSYNNQADTLRIPSLKTAKEETLTLCDGTKYPYNLVVSYKEQGQTKTAAFTGSFPVETSITLTQDLNGNAQVLVGQQ